MVATHTYTDTYDPEVMRWMQPDPTDSDGVHTYVYVGDDPIDFTTGSLFAARRLGKVTPSPVVVGLSSIL